MGGLPVQEDIAKFNKKNKVHIVVGSPGRLRHLIHDKHIDISSVRLLVFDEADKLMEKSFQADINYIFSILPKQKQVIMSSATYPDNAKPFINQYVQNAQQICPDSDSILLGIEQKLTYVKHNSNIVRQTKLRFEELLKILSKKQFKQSLIFCNYQARVAELHKMLTREKWPAEQLYGQQEQTDRLNSLKTLQEYKCRILISTDLAARGIDASNVDLVINFEPPFEWQTYLHRIGRAGRFGSYGIAVSIVSEGNEQKKFKELLQTINGSLNLGNFWNNENINTDDTDDLSSQYSKTKTEVYKPKQDHKYEMLWKMYTSETTQHSAEIESFEELCNSFEKTEETGIKSFTDLLSSFQTYESSAKNDEADNIYCHLKMPLIPVTEYLSSIHNHKTCDTRKLSKNEQVVNENGNAFTFSNGNEKRTQIEIETTKEKCIHRHKKLLDDPGNRDNVNSEYESDNTDALAKAGLPIAFSSSKHNNHKDKSKGIHIIGTEDYHINLPNSEQKNKKVRNKNLDNKNLNIKFNHSEDTKSNGYFKSKYSKPKVHTYRVQDQTDSDEDHGYNTLSQQYSKSQSNTYSASSSKRGIKNSGSNYRNQYYDYESASSSYGLSQNYLNWYRQLKIRVKQIELAVYLDEMSKL